MYVRSIRIHTCTDTYFVCTFIHMEAFNALVYDVLLGYGVTIWAVVQ